jgi:hypothetical protein
MQQFTGTVTAIGDTPAGGSRPAVGVSVTIKLHDGTTPTVYSDNGSTAISNVLRTNERGEYSFYAANGRYTATIAAQGYAVTTTIVLFDVADTVPLANYSASAALFRYQIGAGTGASFNSATRFFLDPASSTSCLLTIGGTTGSQSGLGWSRVGASLAGSLLYTYSDDSLRIALASTAAYQFTTQAIIPQTDGGKGLGLHANRFSNVFANQVTISPAASVTPSNNGDLVFQATSDTSLTFKFKGSDGTVRSASLTLA